jgi:hypothetical protein
MPKYVALYRFGHPPDVALHSAQVDDESRGRDLVQHHAASSTACFDSERTLRTMRADKTSLPMQLEYIPVRQDVVAADALAFELG